MIKCLKTFSRDETGAVSTDWVVLTAAVIMLGVNAVAVAKTGSVEVGGNAMAGVSVPNGN